MIGAVGSYRLDRDQVDDWLLDVDAGLRLG
jgi:hypothetical protein